MQGCNFRFRHNLARYVIAILFTGLCTIAQAKSQKIKCWTNDQGVRECGNYVPQEQVQKKIDVVNEHGQVIDIEDRAKTREELVKEREERRKQKEEERKLAERKRLDQILIQTYASEDDIKYSLDTKVKAIDAQIELLRGKNGKLVDNLQKLTLKAANYERNGKAVPEKILNDIANVKEQMEVHKKHIHAKQKDKKTTQDKHEADLERFRELKKIKPPGQR